MNNVASFLIGMLRGTPWWVFLVFAWLMVRGIQGLYPQVVSLYRIFILPIVFLLLTILPFFKGNVTSLTVICYVGAVIAGLIVGFFLTSRFKILVNKKTQQITLPGSCVTLILVSLIFIIRYYIGYNVAVDSGFRETLTFLFLSFGFGGLVEGFAWGRALCYLQKYFFKSSSH